MMEIAEIYRIIHNLLKSGTVAEVDPSTARLRVQSGEHLSDWLPWLAVRAGRTKTWNPPSVGEQVFLFCPAGELNQAVVLPGLYSTDNPAPQQTGDTEHTVYPDGTTSTYDHSKNTLTLDIKGNAILNTTGNVTADIKGNFSATIGGDTTLDAKGDVKATVTKDLTATVSGKLSANVTGTANVKAGGNATIDAPEIKLNGGAGVVTGAHICQFTGSPHSNCSSTVKAGI